MVLAEFVFLWVGGVLLVGTLGCFALIVAGVVRAMRWVLRELTGSSPQPGISGGVARVCGQPYCGHVNRPGARYCGQCGNRLNGLPEGEHDG